MKAKNIYYYIYLLLKFSRKLEAKTLATSEGKVRRFEKVLKSERMTK